MMQSIPKDVARQLCDEIREENRRKWYSYLAWWCWGCTRFTGEDPAKMCFSNGPDYRGCAQVNARYDREGKEGE